MTTNTEATARLRMLEEAAAARAAEPATFGPDPRFDAVLAEARRTGGRSLLGRTDLDPMRRPEPAGDMIGRVERRNDSGTTYSRTYVAAPPLTRGGSGRSVSHMTTTPQPATPATSAQLDFLASLTSKIGPEAVAWFERNRATLTKPLASDAITRAKDALKKIESATSTPTTITTRTEPTPSGVARPEPTVWALIRSLDVPAGRYAVDGEDGATKFYRVDRPTDGQYAGRTFLKVQAGDDFHNVRGGDAILAILRKIMVDPKAATIRYGHELGVCGVCGRTLTDDASRAAGIGPVCASRF